MMLPDNFGVMRPIVPKYSKYYKASPWHEACHKLFMKTKIKNNSEQTTQNTVTINYKIEERINKIQHIANIRNQKAMKYQKLAKKLCAV